MWYCVRCSNFPLAAVAFVVVAVVGDFLCVLLWSGGEVVTAISFLAAAAVVFDVG